MSDGRGRVEEMAAYNRPRPLVWHPTVTWKCEMLLMSWNTMKKKGDSQAENRTETVKGGWVREGGGGKKWRHTTGTPCPL